MTRSPATCPECKATLFIARGGFPVCLSVECSWVPASKDPIRFSGLAESVGNDAISGFPLSGVRGKETPDLILTTSTTPEACRPSVVNVPSSLPSMPALQQEGDAKCHNILAVAKQ